MESKDFVSSTRKTVLLLLSCLAFVAIATLLPSQPDETSNWRFWTGGFFGLGVLIAVWMLIRPQRLRLTREGFTLSGGFVRSPKVTPWTDVGEFFVYRLPRGGKMIGFNYRPNAPQRSGLAKFNRRFGAEGALPKLWPESAEVMIEELNEYRAQALDTQRKETLR